MLTDQMNAAADEARMLAIFLTSHHHGKEVRALRVKNSHWMPTTIINNYVHLSVTERRTLMYHTLAQKIFQTLSLLWSVRLE